MIPKASAMIIIGCYVALSLTLYRAIMVNSVMFTWLSALSHIIFGAVLGIIYSAEIRFTVGRFALRKAVEIEQAPKKAKKSRKKAN